MHKGYSDAWYIQELSKVTAASIRLLKTVVLFQTCDYSGNVIQMLLPSSYNDVTDLEYRACLAAWKDKRVFLD